MRSPCRTNFDQSLCKSHRTEFSDHGNLDLARELHFVHDLFGDSVCQLIGHPVVYPVLLDNNTNFPPRLNGIGSCHAFERFGNTLQFFKPLYISFDRFAPRAGW